MLNGKSWRYHPGALSVKVVAPLPIPALILLIPILAATCPDTVFEPLWLLPILNFVFLAIIPAVIVMVTLKAYMKSGSSGLLGLSCGAFLMGVSAAVAGLLITDPGGPNKAVTFYNMGFLLAGAFHCAGAAAVLAGVGRGSDPRRRRAIVSVIYLGMVLFMWAWLIGDLKDLTPPFFIQGVGPTPIRQAVLGGGVVLFAVSAGLMGLLYLTTKTRFQYWYSLGLLLIAIGLFCVLITRTVGGPIGWLGRSAQYIGALYLLIAVISAVGEIRARGMTLGEGISGFLQHRLEKLVAERARELTAANERLEREIAERRGAEEALQKAHDELDRRVKERTRDLQQEIERRIKVEAALSQSHARYKGIFEHTRNGVAVYEAVDNGEDFVFVEFNPAGERIERINRQDLMGRRVTEVFPGIRDFGLLEVFQRVWRSGIPESHPLSSYQDGRIAGWRENFVYKLPSGEIVAVYSDETLRKQAEETLERERVQLLSIFDAMPAVVDVVDPKTYEVLFMNRYAKNIYGEEGVGRPCYQVFHDYAAPCSFCNNQEMLEKGDGGLLQWEYYSEVTHRHYMATNTLMRWPDGRVAKFELSIDITARKEAEAEREKLQAQLHQAQRMESIGILAGGVAHDFNNLLTAIIGNAQLALSEIPKGDPLREDLEEIRKAGERGAMLTRQLLAFCRREPRHVEILDLNEVVQDMGKLLHRLVKEDIDLRMSLGSGLWKIRADVGQMEQVIMNLVVNARDVMPEGGTLTIETANVTLDAAFFHAHAVAGEPGQYVMLAVTDTGPGMDEAIQARIFEPFFTTKERGAGTGLGLSTVYGIVKQSGGYIWPYSHPGMGTTMKIYLPRVLDEAVIGPEAEGDLDETPTGQVILVVEDDETVRDLAFRSLEKAGYQVLTATDGEHAVRVWEQFKGEIHLVITDLVMPRMGGRELADYVESHHPQVRVILMSGFSNGDFLEPDRTGSGADFLQKPFSPQILCRKVREALGQGGNEEPRLEREESR